MKKADFITNIVLVPLDFTMVLLAAISAYFFRFSEAVSDLRPILYEISFASYLSLSFKVSIFAIIVFAFSGFYTMRSKKLAKELPKVISGVSAVLIFLVLAIFWQRELFSSRFIIITSWVLAIIYLFIARIFVFGIRNLFFKKGRGLARVLVIGPQEESQPIVELYNSQPRLGFKVLAQKESVHSLYNDQELQQMIAAKQIDDIIQTDSSLSKDDALDLLTYCQENHLRLRYVANLFQAQNINVELNSLAGLPIVEIKETPLDGWRRVYKRIFDFVGAIFLAVILLPIFLVLALLIKLDSPGPIFVSLNRVGRKGETFKLYKFRSMVKDAHKLKSEMLKYNERNDGPLFKMSNDPRITRFGRFLRRTSLDELPQIFNVIRGQMSLVGPRPHEPEEVDKYQRGYKRLLALKPGITGMAQVSGRSNLLFAEEAKLDIFYIENWSIFLDLIIILKTPKAMFNKGDKI
ncbi:MAG: sugar transferase [Patescibacteria group bacterium]|nr:sugar transferase [Patescibacteria group bacterium]